MSSFLNKVFNHPQTTILGMAGAVLSYVASYGPSLPTDNSGWIHFGTSTAILALGIAAADAKNPEPIQKAEKVIADVGTDLSK